jgi:hypothetical protein
VRYVLLFRLCSVLSGVSLVVGRAGITPGLACGLHALSLRLWNSSPTVALLFWVFSVLFVYSLVTVSHSVFVVHKYLLDLFVVVVLKGCSCNICVLFRQLFCQICVLYLSFYLCNASELLEMKGAHASLLKKKIKKQMKIPFPYRLFIQKVPLQNISPTKIIGISI